MSPTISRAQVPRAANDLFVKLSTAIKQGEFTPFLGAGASSLRPRTAILASKPWSQVMQTIAEIASHLETRESLHFIESFGAQRLGLSLDKFREALRPAIKASGGPIFKGNGLIHLQAELIHATVKLTAYFGSLFSRETPSIHELASCSVKFDSASDGADSDVHQLSDEGAETDSIRQLPEGAHNAVRQLLKAAAIAQDLETANDNIRESPFLRRYKGVKRSLEIQRIHEKLLTLIATLLGDQQELYAGELARHKLGEKLPIPADVDAGLTSDFGQLRLDAVQWMSELVWYTLRYWIPCYPTSADLAFELSLKVAKAPARRAELAQAAQALENEYSSRKNRKDQETTCLGDEMASVIRYCEHYQREVPESVVGTSAFYYAIAAALQYQYDLYIDQCQLDDEPVLEITQSEGALDASGGYATVPIAFSTNFDNALEQVFEENDIGYHLVYPTIGGDRRNGKGPVVWRLKTCFPESQNKVSTDIIWLDVPSPPTTPPRVGQLIGPLILKLHGAPCLKEAMPGFKHWLVLSEANYLEALATASNMPKWIRDQLGEETKSRRSLWFLGYSMSDWNVRLRLFEHCKGNQGFRGAVDRESDLYRTALLVNENINVEQWFADLGLLPQRLLEMFVIDRPRRSESVDTLVQGMRKLLEGRE